MEPDVDLFIAIADALRADLPAGTIPFPLTGTIAFSAARAAQRFYAEKALCATHPTEPGD